ncbi:MAG: prepilin-type N-terminal cleavage/methylation domain-containing protein [Elusimicrobiaceae bacterium]|nr:prepilin-type N-terminal cleavage/methylation domain-containing protein [Elusimicrobiaceae bacterium]
MNNKKGFTLLELLIAATIIGILALYATVSYRSSETEIRISAAKGKIDGLAVAVQRFRMDHPRGIHFSGLMSNVTDASANCAPNSSEPTKLITCEVVENGGWDDPLMFYYVCDGKTNECASSPVANPLACMRGKNHDRLPNRYRQDHGYIYCVNLETKGETMGSDN